MTPRPRTVQEGTPFTFAVQAFLSGPLVAAAAATISSVFLAGDTALTVAGTALAANLKAVVASSPTAVKVAQSDQAYATVVSGFDDQLLSLGAPGTVGASVDAFVDAEEKVITDVLAISELPPNTPAWTTRATADPAASQTANNGLLRKALGLPPAPTQSPSAE